MATAPSHAPPFGIHGRVTGPQFADRGDEVARVLRVLRTAGAKLLVRGRRRMGKTSILDVATARARRYGVAVITADLSTASSLAEVSTTLLLAANRALRTRTDMLLDVAKRVATAVELRFGDDGRPALRLNPALFSAPTATQAQGLGAVLDAIDASARAKRRRVAIILDEFQEIDKLDDRAAWTLRGIIQRHDAVSYVCAGSREALIDAMTGRSGAFYRLLDPPLEVEAIDAGFLARWLDERLGRHGVAVSSGVGERCVTLAGPCTLDIMMLADAVWSLGLQVRRRADALMVDEAFIGLIRMQEHALFREWDRLSDSQQQVLRAIAGGAAGLTTAETTRAFGLAASGSVSTSVRALLERNVIRRSADAATGYVFDNPFMRGYVIAHALRDIGRPLPATTLPASRSGEGSGEAGTP